MEFPGYSVFNEPELMFDALTPKPYNIHPLKGLIEYGPYSWQIAPISEIRIAVICPIGCFHIVKKLIGELGQNHHPKERTKYLPSFIGFQQIFKSKVVLNEEVTSIQFDVQKIICGNNKPYISLSNELAIAIQAMGKQKLDFDVLYIYLPESLSIGFNDSETDFDLHDFVKATTAVHNIPTQILRQGKAIDYPCRCSVMWRLSIALYVKAGGVPWKLASLNSETAFIGLSYSTRFNSQTGQYDFTTCCSQVFDSDGTGLEFIAYDTGEVAFRVGDNPFLTRSEMRKLMSKSLSLYQKRHSGRSPKTLIVHKTSYFSREEIDGAFDAVPSNISLELLQIVESSNWKGVKYLKQGLSATPANFPIERGSFFQSGPQEVMLWTQGNVSLAGKNFFKEGKNIPSPILIRRFAGDGGWDQNCQAIIGLTKMNWNHDALYDKLPVTLGYAKVLASTIKRMNNLVNKPYEFRYFM